MKNKILFSLAIVITLASCSQKFSLVKRKYNKGFYLAVTKKQPQTKEVNTKTVAVKNATIQKEHTNSPLIVPNTTSDLILTKAPSHLIKVITEESLYSSEVEHHTLNSPRTSEKLNLEKRTHFKPHHSLKMVKSVLKNSKSKAMADDTNTILLVILCILWWLNLVAVYLHDGRKFTTNFWITLILDFTIIGGIIFSILVVLDIVNLA